MIDELLTSTGGSISLNPLDYLLFFAPYFLAALATVGVIAGAVLRFQDRK